MSIYSEEHLLFLKKEKRNKLLVHLTQLLIIIVLFCVWELLAKLNIINTFLYSSPSRIIKTIFNLLDNSLFKHIRVT